MEKADGDSGAPPPKAPASAAWVVLALAASLLVFFVGLISNMASAPGSSRAFLVEKLGLIGGLGLFFLSLLAFALPSLRRTSALLALVAFAGILLLSLPGM